MSVKNEIWRGEGEHQQTSYWYLKRLYGRVTLCRVDESGEILQMVASLDEERGILLHYTGSKIPGVTCHRVLKGTQVGCYLANVTPHVELDEEEWE